MLLQGLLLAYALSGTTYASIPAKSGYNLIWSDDFNGPAGAPVNSANWFHATPATNANAGEVQQYTSSTANSRLSGDGALQIIPIKSSSGQWTSARLEGTQDFTCQIGHTMIVEAQIRFGLSEQSVSQQQGIWPAFWALGASSRRSPNPVTWPTCGEWDIFEARDGVSTNYGTLHCDVAPGGICNEYTGLGASTSFSAGGLHTYAIKVDRTQTNPNLYTQQSLTWYVDGVAYKTITGATIGDYNTWVAVARSPMYLIMNVAVGGAFPGQPNSATLGGAGAGMYVHYVAVYGSA